MLCGIKNEQLDRTIGVDTMPYRKKLCLVIQEGNQITKYATFNNNESAKEFMIKFAETVGLDWESDKE